VSAGGCLHDGITTPHIASEDTCPVVFAEDVNNLGVSGAGGKHQCCLMILVEGGARVLVACIEKNLADVAVAERGSQMKVGIREAFEGGVGIMEEGWMGSENAADEQGVIGMDSTPQADGCVNPRGEEEAYMVSVERTLPEPELELEPDQLQLSNSHIAKWSWCALTVPGEEHLPWMSKITRTSETNDCWG
jgi:hypothetical protein